jgi:hypothetical protein
MTTFSKSECLDRVNASKAFLAYHSAAAKVARENGLPEIAADHEQGVIDSQSAIDNWTQMAAGADH